MLPSGNFIKRKAIFLDRDGVLNKSILVEGRPFAPRSKSHLELLPSVPEAVRLLINAGFELVVVTNQPDLSRGLITNKKLKEIHEEISKLTGLKYFYVCAHNDDDKCECRKPKLGLIFKAVSELNLDIKGSYLVGDRWRDIEAGQKAGLTCFFIDYSYQEKQPLSPFFRVTSLMEAAHIIIKDSGI